MFKEVKLFDLTIIFLSNFQLNFISKHFNEENNGYPTDKEIAKVILDTFNTVISDRTLQNIRHKSFGI